MNPLFSVIVASYNYANLIGETLESLLAQTYQDYEIIVVDDGSTDNSLSVIDNYMKQSDKIKLYTHPDHQNKGLIETIKLGIQMSSGEYIAFCESDDLWTSNHLEEKAKVIRENSHVFIISNDVEVFGNEDSVKVRTEYTEHIKTLLQEGDNHVDLLENGEVNVIPTFSAVTIKKNILAKLNFEAPIPAWIDFWLYRQILRDYNLYFIPRKLTRWRMHESYNDLNKSAEYMLKSKEFLAQSNRLLLLNYTDDEFYLFIKSRFHKSHSWAETHYLWTLFNKGKHDKKLKRKLHRKFLWYRVLHFWKNYPWSKFQNPNEHYNKYIRSGNHNKNILIFTHEMELTGAPRAALTLANTLKEIGYAPLIISPKAGKLTKEAKKLKIPTIIDYMLGYKFQKRDELLHQFVACFDVLFFNTIETYQYATFLKDTNAKKIGWIHEGSFSFKEANQNYNLGSLFTAVEKTFFVSEYSKACAKKYVDLPQDCDYLLYGCEDIPNNSQEHLSTQKTKFLMIGSIGRRKGMFLIGKALDCLSPEVLNQIEIKIIGTSGNKRSIRRIKNIKYNCLKYLGERKHQEVISIFKDSDIFLCPSLDDPMPIVCTEAMILRKVIITTDHTGTASLLKDGESGFIIKADDPKAISEAIEKVITLRNKYASIGNNARSIYEKYFTMNAFKHRVTEVFDKL